MTKLLNLNIFQVIPIVIWLILLTGIPLIFVVISTYMSKEMTTKKKLFIVITTILALLITWGGIIYWGIIPFGFVRV